MAKPGSQEQVEKGGPTQENDNQHIYWHLDKPVENFPAIRRTDVDTIAPKIK